MDKIKIDTGAAFFYPMPVVLVGSVVEGKANVMPVGWISRVNYEPPLFMVALGPHHTNRGIEENREFSINVPDVSLIEQTDYCGIVSGSTTDKSDVFDIFYGALDKAPLIRECPICMSCTLYDTVKLSFDTLYIGEVKEMFTEERYLTDQKPDVTKIRPFLLTMPDNHYWSLGDAIATAWNIGNNFKKK